MQKARELEEALRLARTNHADELASVRAQLSQQTTELLALRERNVELEANLRAGLNKVSSVINSLSSSASTHPVQLQQHSDPLALFTSLVDGLEKLNGLAQRREAYVQYLNQEQTSVEEQLSVLKAEVETTTEQLQHLKQQQDDTQQALHELNADLKQKHWQLHELEEQLQHKLQLSYDRLLDLTAVLEQRKQEAKALASQAEEKVTQSCQLKLFCFLLGCGSLSLFPGTLYKQFALLRTEQASSQAHAANLLRDLSLMSDNVEQRLKVQRAR
jgi:chromosome segregation ATPase